MLSPGLKHEAEASRPERLCGRMLRCNQKMPGLYEAFSAGSGVLRACVHGPDVIKGTPNEREGVTTTAITLITPVLFPLWRQIISTHRVPGSAGNENVCTQGCLFEYQLFTDADSVEWSDCMRKYLL